MRRTSFLLILVGLCATPVFSGGNPDDIDFKIRFVEDKSFFHIVEPIEIEISYSTKIENKYLGSWTSPSPGLHSFQHRLSWFTAGHTAIGTGRLVSISEAGTLCRDSPKR